MKLLLTSNGFSHPLIVAAFKNLVGAPLSGLHLVFVPTAANMIDEDKQWLIDDLNRCKDLGFASIDIVDIAVMEKSQWLPRLQKADVLLFGGGDNAYLYKQMEKSGLVEEFPSLLVSRVYVGISAGSMVAGPFADDAISTQFFGEPFCGRLGFTAFWLKPHLNSPDFPERTLGKFLPHFEGVPYDTYLLDDESAVVVDGEDLQVVSGGEWKLVRT